MSTVARPEAGAEVVGASAAGFLGRALRIRPGEATWVVAAHLAVVVLAAVLYLVNLTVSGYANTYYSAAAQAASQSWSAWFFGSIDAANFITLDKPPLATMLMGLSVRLLGLSSWSVLLPEALAGVATVAVLFALVRRTFGPVAAVVAGLVAALTPAAVLMFRYNNPDALLTLLLVLAAYAFIRALETDRLRWVAAAAILVGFAFNTKYLQAYLVLPAFGFTYAIAAPGGVRRRIVGLAVAIAGVIASSGWWVLAMELLPADARPYIGGSTTNSALELIFGYDGLGRIFGQGAAGGPIAAGGPGFSGTAGLLRLFNAEFGGQVAWFIPLALIGLAAGLWARRHASRTDLARAAYLFWGLWLLTHAAVFSFMSGIVHTYYAIVMAPAIGALVGGGLVELWKLRSRTRWGGVPLAASLVASGTLAWQLLERTPDFAPGLSPAILAVTVLVARIIAIPAWFERHRPRLIATGLGLAVLLAGPVAYAIDTMATAYSGGGPSAGPTAASAGPGGFADRGAVPGGLPGLVPPAGADDIPPIDWRATLPGAPGGAGAASVNAARTDYLVANKGAATWIVAVSGAWEAGAIQLATGEPVMAMGGFSGGDPAPTLAELQDFVARGQLRFVLARGRAGPGGPVGGFGGLAADDASGAGTSSVMTWVTSACTEVDYGAAAGGSSALYDCAGAVTNED